MSLQGLIQSHTHRLKDPTAFPDPSGTKDLQKQAEKMRMTALSSGRGRTRSRGRDAAMTM